MQVIFDYFTETKYKIRFKAAPPDSLGAKNLYIDRDVWQQMDSPRRLKVTVEPYNEPTEDTTT